MERALLLPLIEIQRDAEVLERQSVSLRSSGREDDTAPAGFYAGWEFREMPREERPGVLFDLADDPVIVLDETSAIEVGRGKISRATGRGV